MNPRHVFLPIVLAGSACASTPAEPDRTAFLVHVPHSVLVLPPLDETGAADAPYGWLPTITRPLAERGYYVFPVAIVDMVMKENGLTTPEEMHRVPRQRLWEIFGADAVLYADIRAWGPSLHDLEVETMVAVDARLVDVRSGTELWRGSSTAFQRSSEGTGAGFYDRLFSPVVDARAPSAVDPAPGLARQANWSLVHSPQGLLLGPRHPGFEADERRRREFLSASAR